jgi:dUTP pyrophosphatase
MSDDWGYATLRELEERVEILEDLLVNPRHLLFKKLHPDAVLPAKAGPLEACYDMCCVKDDEFYVDKFGQCRYDMRVGESHIFHTGLACDLPDGRALFLWDRSGMGAKRNVHRLAGCVDSCYKGQILVCLVNLSSTPQVIYAGDRIIQAHLSLVLPGTPTWTDTLSESYRGENGFGSTGQ